MIEFKMFNKSIFSIGKKSVLPSIDALMRWYEAQGLREGGKVTLHNAITRQSWVYSVVYFIARNIARAPFKLYSDLEHKKEITKGPAYDFFINVNEYLSRSDLWEGTMLYKLLRGESVWHVIRTGNIVEFEFLEPLKINEIISKTRQLLGYRYMTEQGEIPIEKEDVIHFKYFNPDNNFRGLSPLSAVMKGMNIDYNAQVFNETLMKNGFFPGGAVEVDHDLSDESFERMVQQIEKRHSGSDKAGKLMLLDNGAKLKDVKMTPQEAQYIEQRKMSKEEIHGVYGVPAGLLGDRGDMNYSNMKQASADFWVKRLIPELIYIQDVLAQSFFPKLFPEATIYGAFDLSSIPELQEDLNAKYEAAYKLFTMGFTANEINDKLNLGFEKKDWRDKWWIPLSLMPAGEGGVSDEDTEPAEDEPAPDEDNVDRAISGIRKFLEADNEKEYQRKYVKWKLFINKVSPLLTRFQSALRKYIYELRKEVLLNFFNSVQNLSAEEIKVKINTKAINFFDKNIQKKKLIDMAQPFYEDAIMQGGTLALSEIGIDEPFKLVNDRTINFLNSQKAGIAKILDTVEINLELTIQNGIEQGWTQQQIADSIRDVMNVTENRARTIAQTEIIGSANGGRFEAYRENGIGKKEWINSFDSKVREEHMIVETVELDNEFSNGLKYPGDKTGSGSVPENIINCRCTIGAVV